ncbi:IFRD domain-containing protein [Histoplasma capsulatum G186AR]|uniref:IFRD domain-containing protein n=2 Tax=Ajellomyces capsulatus TaxID=5037 RepID=C0NJ30_AJECG|nr:IFRD domain-containing protein [Histoplasma capsulatum G186AR]EEH07871.1 IFRD domain-containing protein [Histoplasma capsulatum G186AR]KAG5299794.1 IFRD domain-containing protein [Histoplasma capsulatum]QSS67579.1 IFRD domain-containing protein [Histoplasma capsulatum G186AR]
MRDLRRQALESKKTVSRKAQSREASRATSRTNSAHNSRPSSRNASRHPSDDEDGESEGTAYSTPSLDEYFPSANDEETTASSESWQADLEDVIRDFNDRKRSSVLSREDALTAYVRILTSHYVEEALPDFNELLASFAKSIKSESSEKETVLALKAVSLTVLTFLDESIYDQMVSVLRRTITDSPSMPIKAAAIHCLGACTFFGGAGEDEILEQMNFLLEIVSSDGHYVNAGDDADVVTAALEEWGFLATEVEDLEHESEDAIEAFVEQLESSEASVQIAAGENIALLYEKSYTPLEEGESIDDGEDEGNNEFSDGEGASSLLLSDDEDAGSGGVDNGPPLIKRYNPYHNTPRILRQVDALANVSGRHINKKSKRSLHANFSSILTTIANPRRGPQYSRAIDNETSRQYGTRKTVKIHQDASMKLDRWWKWLRLAALRRLLRWGFVTHYFEGSRGVLECLPVMVRPVVKRKVKGMDGGGSSSSSSGGGGGKKGGRRKGVEMF